MNSFRGQVLVSAHTGASGLAFACLLEPGPTNLGAHPIASTCQSASGDRALGRAFVASSLVVDIRSMCYERLTLS